MLHPVRRNDFLFLSACNLGNTISVNNQSYCYLSERSVTFLSLSHSPFFASFPPFFFVPLCCWKSVFSITLCCRTHSVLETINALYQISMNTTDIEFKSLLSFFDATSIYLHVFLNLDLLNYISKI